MYVFHFRIFKNFGSIKKNTGMSTSSLGSNRCSSKQKRWILLKYKPAFMGNVVCRNTNHRIVTFIGCRVECQCCFTRHDLDLSLLRRESQRQGRGPLPLNLIFKGLAPLTGLINDAASSPAICVVPPYPLPDKTLCTTAQLRNSIRPSDRRHKYSERFVSLLSRT